MASYKPDRIETEHVHAVYSLFRHGYDCSVACGSCGARGRSFVPDFAADRSDAALPEGWGTLVRRLGDRILNAPRCADCIARAADALADELLSIA